MTVETANPITRTLVAAAGGDLDAASQLLPLVYTELRRLAQSRLSRLAPGQTLQATALVHEAYLRVAGVDDPGWHGRGHFFGAAAQAMRDILVEDARRKSALKRGGDRRRIDLDHAQPALGPPDFDILALDEAVRTLEASDPRKGKIINLRYFAGLTAEETAALLDVSLSTVEREWRYIRAWLRTRLTETEGGGNGQRARG